MTEEPPNIVLVKLEEIRKDIARTNENVGVLASSMVALKREFQGMQRDVARLQRDIDGLKGSVGALVVAVDDHTHRLDGIEEHNKAIDVRLDRIDAHLDAIEKKLERVP
jgi:chromosome segregation ATPase